MAAYDSPPETAVEDKTESALTEAKEWLDKIKTREKAFEQGWWKQAEVAQRIYSGDFSEKAADNEPYNILYSNTEVIKPSLYSQTPKPDVRSRFKEVDLGPVPIAVERFLTILSDPSNPGEESLDNAMAETVLSSLVPGMGFIRLRYYTNRPLPLCFESGHYKGLIWGPARKWSKVPWIAYRHELTKEELFSQFKIPADDQDNYSVDDSSTEEDPDKKKGGTIVYELWDKTTRKITFLCEDWKEIILREEDDTLGLEGFYSTPGPLLMTQKPGKIVPIPLYQYYRNQAEELNRVTVRLNKVLEALKVRGAYSSFMGSSMAQILDTQDDMENKLIPAAESVQLSQNGGFDRNIWLLPLEKLVAVATQLYQARQQIKAVIYELTGISDILRGSSVASETATAQDLKNKWGTIRLRDMQKAVADYVRDLYRLATDCGAKKVPPAQWNAMIQMGLPTEQEKALAQQQLQHLMMLGQQMMQAGQQPPPQGIQQAQQLQQTLQKPSIDSVVKQIASDANRTYTINVQSNSTVDLDTATDKAEVQEFMNAMGQLLAGLQPLATLGPTGLQAAKAILIAVCQRFKFGLAIVDDIAGIQQPPPAQTGPTPEQQKKEQDLQQQQAALEAQSEQNKQQLNKIADEQRALEAAKSDFEAEVKVIKGEMAAEKAIQDAQKRASEQVQGAQQEVAAARGEADFIKKKSDLQSIATGAKVAQKASQQASQAVAPVQQTVEKAFELIQGLQKQLEVLATQKKRAVQMPDGSWTAEVIK